MHTILIIVLGISIVRIKSDLSVDHADHASPGTVQFVAPLLVRCGGQVVTAAARAVGVS